MELDLAYFVDDVDMAIPRSGRYAVHPSWQTEACWRSFDNRDLQEMISPWQIEGSSLTSQHDRVSRSPMEGFVGLSR